MLGILGTYFVYAHQVGTLQNVHYAHVIGNERIKCRFDTFLTKSLEVSFNSLLFIIFALACILTTIDIAIL